MMSNNTDYQNNLLNQLAYVDLGENYKPGDNLIDVLENSNAGDLAVKLKEAGYGDYVIQDYVNQNDSNGFAAIAIKDPKTGDVGISYRGTENLNKMGQAVNDIVNGNFDRAANQQIDMIDNISTAVTGDSDQAQQALAFFEKNQSTTGNNYLYGHSKGGELALEVYVENYNDIESVHIINPQPIDWAHLSPDQYRALQNGKIDATVINGDLVWLLGGVPYNVRIIKNNGAGDDFFDPHDLQSASYDQNGAAVIEPFPYAGYPIQGILGGGLCCVITLVQGGYRIGEAIGETVYEWFEGAYQFFTEELPEYAQRFWDFTNNLWQETKEKGMEVIDNVKDFFDGLAEAAENWWDDIFGKDDDKGSGSGHSSPGPCQVRVDTQQLRAAAGSLQSVSRTLDSLASTIGKHARSMQRITFVGTAALKGSLAGITLQANRLGNDTEKLAKALTDIAELYDRTEKQITGVAQS